MFIVYVKHYLTTAGLRFFNQEWFPRVQLIMSQQQGYVSVIHDTAQDQADCINIIVTFESEAALLQWANHPEHDALVNALDRYRSRTYWEALGVNAHINPKTMTWDRIEVIK